MVTRPKLIDPFQMARMVGSYPAPARPTLASRRGEP
jgi:hypothetical protein